MRFNLKLSNGCEETDNCRLLSHIGKGERIALSKLAVEHLERTGRPYRIAIDAAIWNFQNQAGQGGANPALRTLFYRLLKLLALPIHPVFVYDGRNKPLTKRNKTVHHYGTSIPNEQSKNLVAAFRFPHHTAPGEAEAECALLQRRGVVDAVMSQDVDTLAFGATATLRNWSKEGSRGNKTATHINVLRATEVKSRTGLDPEGMVLVALLSGGDYNTDGVAGIGPGLALEIAKAGFGAELLVQEQKDDKDGLHEWRERLQYELESNESGYFKRRHKTVKIPEDFPDRIIVGYYTTPAVSTTDQLETLRQNLEDVWDTEIDIPALREYVAQKFEWLYNSGARKLVRNLAPALLAHRLRRGIEVASVTSMDQIKERRTHFVNDGMPELRVEVVPANVLGLDLEAEEDNPAYLEETEVDAEEVPATEDVEDAQDEASIGVPSSIQETASPSKGRKRPPWNPYLPEKMWIPETILKLGVPALVEAWEQKQRDIMADPRKFAARKCSKTKTKPVKGGMKAGALDSFFTTSKPDSTREASTLATSQALPKTKLPDRSQPVPRTPTKKSRPEPAGESSPTVERYFGKIKPLAGLDRWKDGTMGVALPSHARYSALGLYGADAQPMGGGTVASKHSRPSSSESAEATGTLSQPILLSSSPSVADPTASLPTPPGSTSSTTPAKIASASAAEIPPTVTQRSKRRVRARITIPEDPENALSSLVDLISPPALPLATLTTRSANKKAVLSRDSLPGAWKELDEGEVALIAGAGQKRISRVSTLDLSGD